MNTLLLIDGHAIMYRAFYALPSTFKTKEGLPTNALYGFLSMLYKCITDFKPEYVVVCFDTPHPTFRNLLSKEYQAQRPKVADEFKIQVPYIKELVDKAGIARLEKDGYEADDIIGTLVSHYKSKNMRVLILSGDKDLLQLVDENVFVLFPKVGVSSLTIYDTAKVKEKLGIQPSQIPDWKALAGDQSDNYKGSKGIGPKTATKLFVQYPSLNHLLDKLDSLSNEKLKTLIIRNKDNINLAKQLATIRTDVPFDFELKSAKFSYFKSELNDFLKKLNIGSLRKRIFQGTYSQNIHIEESNKTPLDNIQPELFSS